MAYNICSSPSSLFHDLHPLCNSLSPSQRPKPRNFTCPLKPGSIPPHSLQITRASAETQISQETQKPYSKPAASKPKRYAWVNPRSTRTKQLAKKTDDSRYNFLSGVVAESLNGLDAVEVDVSGVLSKYIGKEIVSGHDAGAVLENLQNLDTMMLALRFFVKNLKLSDEKIVYNMTLRACRKRIDFGRAEAVFEEMVENGVKPDNITFDTLISCAMMSLMPYKAVELFERMPSFGCEPDRFTISNMIDAYAKVGNTDMALRFYDRARTNNWSVGVMSYISLIRMYADTGNYDGCSNLYEEMKVTGVKPNLFLYNTMLISMGRGSRPWQAKRVFQEMIENGVSPDRRSYGALIRSYARGRYYNDAYIAYKEMKEKGMRMSVLLYNTLLSMYADMGLDAQAFEIFEDMKSCEVCKPDSWTYSSMITVYCCCGEVSKAEAMLNEMIEAGLEPTLHILTSMIQCYGKMQHLDNVLWTFDLLLKLGLTPDDRFCCCLLSVMAQTPREELYKLVGCIETANLKLYSVLNLLVEGQDGLGEFEEEATELLASSGTDVKMSFCNCLLDVCVHLNLKEGASKLLDIGIKLGIYRGLQLRSPTQWSLYVKYLSRGAALTAFHVWVNDLSKALESGEELPPVLGINTGHGIHKYSDNSLAAVFESQFQELNIPFHEDVDNSGWYLTTNIAAKSWLLSRQSSPDLVAV